MIISKKYQHKNNTDVAFKPISLQKETQDTLTFLGAWYNIVSKPSFCIDIDTVTIKKTDLDNWSKLDE